MFLNPLQEHLSYNQLSKQVKSRNKQIRFLQDKIILLQNERESKIAQIQSRFLLQIERFKQTQKALQQQAILLRRRLQKRQLSYSSLQQSYRQLSNQVKVLTQSNSSSIKQSKSMKRRYNQQQHEMARIQQENIQLKSLINILQKQLRELTQKNIKLLQQKSWLMNTYQDYEHVRYQLQEIRSVHNDQYKKQVQIVKSKFRQQMDSNTRKILGQQLMNGYTGVNRIGQLSENMGGTIPRSKTIQKEDKEDKQLMNNQTKKREQNYSLKEKVQSRQQSCGKCVFESSWSEDLIKLKHLIQYGEEYLSVISKQQQLQQQQQQLQQQQQQLQQQQLQQLQQQQQQQQQYPTYQQSKPFSLSFSGNLTFNHSQSKQILAFILQILNNNQLLKIQLHEQSLIFNKIKHQFQQQTQSLLNKINQLTLQQSQRDHQLQQIQKQYQQKHQLQSNQYMLQLNQHKLQLSQLIRLKQKLYLSNQKSNQSKKLISVLSKLIAKISLNYLNLWNKHQLQHKLINCTNNKHPSNNMNNNYLQQDPNYQKQRTQTMITSKSKESTKIKIKLKLKLKLKKVILSLIFIAKLKKASSKLRRKTLLIQGYKKTSSKKNINTINKQQNQYQNNSLLNIQHEEQSQFYTQSTYDLILNHYHIPRQIQIQCQFNFSQINHKLSSQKIHQLLLKCLFQTLKDQILHSKSIQSENLQIQKFFNNIQKSQKLASIHQSAIKIVCQQIFLQKTF